jgi:hypothetical protein
MVVAVVFGLLSFFGGAEFAKGLSASVGSLGLGRCVESTAPQDFQPGRVAISFFSW